MLQRCGATRSPRCRRTIFPGRVEFKKRRRALHWDFEASLSRRLRRSGTEGDPANAVKMLPKCRVVLSFPKCRAVSHRGGVHVGRPRWVFVNPPMTVWRRWEDLLELCKMFVFDTKTFGLVWNENARQNKSPPAHPRCARTFTNTWHSFHVCNCHLSIRNIAKGTFNVEA